jgi:hypothetical protein
VRRDLNEVGHGRAQYIIDKLGEPTAAIVSMGDSDLLQAAKRRQVTESLQQLLAQIHERGRDIEPQELDAFVEEARAELCRTQDGEGGLD